MTSAPAPQRHARGLFVVILLGVIFFALLAALVIFTGRKHGGAGDAPAASETLTVMLPRIRIRTEPNPRAPIVTTAISGVQLVAIEEHGEWVRVQAADGLNGWTERSSLERTGERERRLARATAIRKLPALNGIATDRAPLYAGPGIFYPVIGDLPAHQKVKVYTRDHDFFAIEHSGEVAYADVDAIDVSASGAPQLDVRTTDTAPVPTQTTASMAPPPTETTEPPPLETPPVAPEPAYTNPTGVYSVVPAGGTQPEEIDRVVPRYPPMARRAGAAGPVVIRGIVRRDGTIDEVEIIRDLPYGLGEAAKEAVEQWRFRPATYRGEPIDVYYTVTVNFRLQ
ncbi:MAG TPA: TonB family protein [Thermoanaerobaculia bacterium]|nr:TonB family protein [Thermoanaerobaculia bacterium]